MQGSWLCAALHGMPCFRRFPCENETLPTCAKPMSKSRSRILIRRLIALVALGLSISVPEADAGAGEGGRSTSWTLSAGGILSNTNSKVSGFNSAGNPIDVDAERDLGLPRSTGEAWFRLEYRLNDDWWFYGEFLRTQRSGTILRQTKLLLFGFLPLVIGTRYQTRLRLDNYSLGAGYPIISNGHCRADITDGREILGQSQPDRPAGRRGLDLLDAGAPSSFSGPRHDVPR